mgnify:FL=1
MANIGQIIENKYEILKRIGKGGMSEVYLAMDRNLNKQWAVKEIKKKARDRNNEVVIQSAIAEANMMKKLDHPCLPRIVDIIDRKNVIYVVMDYIEGEPLSKILEQYGAQPQEIVIEWAKELAGVLEYLHMQDPPIIYRDMKPANIMLQPNGNIKLIDFGIAREYKEQNVEDTVSLGTKGYAAPEQFGGKGQTDPRTDIYCLGVTLYHLVTGQNPCEPPYELYPIRHWKPELSAGLESIILKCTQMNPQDRYSSCAELLYALQHYEEEDDAYKKQLKRKLRIFAGTVAASVMCVLAGVACQAVSAKMNNDDYETYLLQAEKSATYQERVQNCLDAIHVKPNDTEAYRKLIEAYKEDAVFTIEEEAQFKTAINSHLKELSNSKGYAELAFETGKLYWYFYDYGKTAVQDNQITRMKSAVQWFEDACTYATEENDAYRMASVYKEIGKFNQDVTIKVAEASDQGMYLPYYENLKKLYEMVEKQDKDEIVDLEVYRICLFSIEQYVRKFQSDEVPQDDIREFLQAVVESTQNTQTTSDKTDELKRDILDRVSQTQQAVMRAYGGT